jgi:aldehyde:ferredoxin oxidoreductase
MGQGVREFDMPPYRAVGPVTKEEYESRAERYDGQLKDIVGVDPAGKTTEEKMKLHRDWRMGRYNQLVDAVYKRRGWTPNGVPTMETLKKFGIDFPDVVAVVRPHLG